MTLLYAVVAAFVIGHLGATYAVIEPLYRYLRKFHALGNKRYVLVAL